VSPPLPFSPSRPLILSAHQAIRVTSPAEQGRPVAPIEAIAADEKQFVRDMPRDRFPLFSTGIGLDLGAADPHWEIAAVSTDPKFIPRQAVVSTQSEGRYPQFAESGSRWISLTADRPGMPAGCRWTCRTKFNLSGFDPTTAHIEGRVCADDWPVEMRLNGKKVPFDATKEVLGVVPFRIGGNILPGENTLEVVIENGPGNGPANVMALDIEIQGTALRTNPVEH
jgi:hypothetical protein